MRALELFINLTRGGKIGHDPRIRNNTTQN